jgi:hypothetical protein
LVECCEELVNKDGIAWLKPRIHEIRIAAALALSRKDVSFGKAYGKSDVKGQSEAIQGLNNLNDGIGWSGGSTVKTRGTGVIPIDVGCTIHKSFCTGKTVSGNICLLEDGKTVMSSEEGVMWHNVTPFSPLETHGVMSVY